MFFKNWSKRCLTQLKDFFGVKKPLELLLNPQLRHEQKKAVGAKRKYFKDMFDRINQSKAYQGFFSSMWYSAMPCFDVKGLTAEKDGHRSILKYCEWKEKRIPCSALFTTFPTGRNLSKENSYHTSLLPAIAKQKAKYLHKLILSLICFINNWLVSLTSILQ